MKKEGTGIKLSIITPYYKVEKELRELNEVLKKQLREGVEWIVVNDGCKKEELEGIEGRVIHLEKNSGGASVPRNKGIDEARGEYIAFIDADDLIEEDYVEMIIKKIEEEKFDYCYISWRSDVFKIVITENPPDWNCCVWNTVYRREIIGKERFKPEIIIGEDYDFNVRVRKGKRSNIEKILYYYRDTPNSLMKRGSNA